jgi:hypothetical protein
MPQEPIGHTATAHTQTKATTHEANNYTTTCSRFQINSFVLCGKSEGTQHDLLMYGVTSGEFTLSQFRQGLGGGH